MPSSITPWRARVAGHELVPLAGDWEAAPASPDDDRDATRIADLAWRPARVPGTAAGALRDAGLMWNIDLDAEDWWFRTRFEAEPAANGEEVVLRLDGIATVADVYLNGTLVLESESMFAAHSVEVGDRLVGSNELVIRCRALGPQLAVQRKPRARWRTRLVSDGSLRWFRTMLLGRAPGFAPGPAAVGPWRPIWLERRRAFAVDQLELRPRLEGDDGVLEIRARLRGLGLPMEDRVDVELDGPSGRHVVSLQAKLDEHDRLCAQGELRVSSIRRWWPHTHGEPALHDVRVLVRTSDGDVAVEAGRVGFRTLAAGVTLEHDIERDGLDLHVNGVRTFARGAIWTPLDLVSLAATAEELRTALERVRAAGMNMVRLPGVGAYEQKDFYDLCDELGILVWQDFMFANLDYPFADGQFRRLAEREASEALDGLVGRPSLTVLCGNSEIEQQVAMLGLDADLGRVEFFRTTLPALALAAGADAIYVPSAPCGGELPFRPNEGIANYYGVGAYLRPLADARAANVRFAAECLAFANVPDEEVTGPMLSDTADFVRDPLWKAGVPRDVGADWDFEDVRDHYLGLLFGVDPDDLRRLEPHRYLELSRAVTGEVMAEVFGEWRRAGSPCGGGLILWLRDLVPGAGWGVLDYRGEPKIAYHHLRRALAPLATWLTDEGLGGVVAHVANDGAKPIAAWLRIALYHDFEQPVGVARHALELAPHATFDGNVETLIGHFVDASWAYRFGPPTQDLIVASLEQDGELGLQILSQAFRYPAGRPTNLEPAERLGLMAVASVDAAGTPVLAVTTRRFAYGVRLHVPGFRPDDDAFSVEPGGTRVVRLRPIVAGGEFTSVSISALNLAGRVGAIRSAPTLVDTAAAGSGSSMPKGPAAVQ